MINIELEQVVSCELVDRLFVPLDLVLDANDFVISVAMQSSPKFLNALDPVMVSDVSLLLSQFSLSCQRHQMLKCAHC